MRKTVIAAAIAIAAVATLGGGKDAAAADTYALYGDHTNVIFFIDHLGFSAMEGEFDDVQGSFVFDKDDPSKSSVKVVIKTASIDTDVEALDKHLRSADFFDAEKYPEIIFESRKIEITGEKTGNIIGDLTMHGVTKSVTLKVKFNRDGENPNIKKYVAGFSATTTLTRSDFGIKTYVPYVGDEIEIRIEMEGIRQDAM